MPPLPGSRLVETLRGRFAASAHLPAPLSGVPHAPGDPLPSPAAILAAIVDRPQPTLLLTTRTAHLRNHPGQVAFPGGRVDPGDADPVATALREAAEEIALPPAAVTIIGMDDAFTTGTGFSIVPVVGVIPPDLPLAPHEYEVADIFEVPLDMVLDPVNHHSRAAELNGGTRCFHEIVWRERRIWGVTAALIVNLGRRLRV